MPVNSDVEAVDLLIDKYKLLRSEVARVIVGQDAVVKNLLISIFCKGHCLLVGVPGLAKTLRNHVRWFSRGMQAESKTYRLVSSALRHW